MVRGHPEAAPVLSSEKPPFEALGSVNIVPNLISLDTRSLSSSIGMIEVLRS